MPVYGDWIFHTEAVLLGSPSTPMNSEELARSATTDPEPPAGLTATARVLWLAKAGQWHAAHDLCQDLPDPAGSWIHAWLHRQEGDTGNAGYWYHRAGKPMSDAPLDQEWQEIAGALLG